MCMASNPVYLVRCLFLLYSLFLCVAYSCAVVDEKDHTTGAIQGCKYKKKLFLRSFKTPPKCGRQRIENWSASDLRHNSSKHFVGVKYGEGQGLALDFTLYRNDGKGGILYYLNMYTCFVYLWKMFYYIGVNSHLDCTTRASCCFAKRSKQRGAERSIGHVVFVIPVFMEL